MKRFILLLIVILILPAYSQITWQQTNGPMGGAVLSINEGPSGSLYIGTLGGLYRTTNNGASWTLLNIPGYYVADVAYNSTYIFAASANDSKLYRSSDNGNTWNWLSSISEVKTIAASAGYLIAGSYLYVYISTDNGNTWTDHFLSEDINQVIIGSGGYMYAASTGELFRSTDYGSTWQNLSYPGSVRSMKINSSGDIFIASYDGIYVSKHMVPVGHFIIMV